MSKKRLSYGEIKEVLESNLILLEEHTKLDNRNQHYDFFINSKEACPDDAFIAFKGASFDRHDVIPELNEKGVKLFIVDDKSKVPTDLDANFLVVKDSREAWSFLEAEAFDNPQSELKLIGVTGTNGKSSTTWIISECLRLMGKSYLLMGTMGFWLNDKFRESKHTTPDPDVLFALLREAADAGVDYCVMEVSSHALCQKKVAPLNYQSVAFTSFSRDHLDFHDSMQEYFDVKWSFIKQQVGRGATAYVSSGVEKYVTQYCLPTDNTAFTYYRQNLSGFAGFNIKSMDINGSAIEISAKRSNYSMAVSLMGLYSIENLVAAILCLESCEEQVLDLSRASEIRSVPGRLDSVDNDKNLKVFVDYAHTPDALYKTCELLRPLCKGKLIVVFGAGGDRDKGKRPLMAEASEAFADKVFVTSDNPRTENPESILKDIKSGFKSLDNVYFITDRRDAIQDAINEAERADVVLIAGKGHEDYQIIGTQKIRFDDKEEARTILGELK